MAEFAYDALGRRIRKIDSIASETTLYYHNNNWQVLAETDANGTTQRWFVYGNYIDEPLMMYANCIEEIEDATHQFERKYYYIQDGTYNVRVLVSAKGWVVEEQSAYDVYGKPTTWPSADVNGDRKCNIIDLFMFNQAVNKSECDTNYNWRCDVDNSGAVTTTDQNSLSRNFWRETQANENSLFTNPYYFTGRRLDILDDGALTVQYNRNRYYDYYTGRWLTHDPLGITPNAQKQNPLNVIGQYEDALNLYEMSGSNPVLRSDPWGLLWPIPMPTCPIFKKMAALTVKAVKLAVKFHWVGRKYGNPYDHCVSSCELARLGGRPLAIAGEWVKESFDEEWYDFAEEFPDFCWKTLVPPWWRGFISEWVCSAWQTADLKDNKKGRDCGLNLLYAGLTCVECCTVEKDIWPWTPEGDEERPFGPLCKGRYKKALEEKLGREIVVE